MSVGWFITRGDALRACPWLSYFAPLALRNAKLHRRIVTHPKNEGERQTASESAEGAEYDSQGQALSASPLVKHQANVEAGRAEIIAIVLRPFRAHVGRLVYYQGRRASRLPLAFIFRAVGAQERQTSSANSYAP